MVSFCNCPAYGNSSPSISEEELMEKHANVNDEVQDGNQMASARSIGTSNETELETVGDGSAQTKKGMILPFVPLSLTFDNITYSVDMPQVRQKMFFKLFMYSPSYQ
jgi:hypothetical protein